MPHKSEIGLRRVVLTLDAAQETAGVIEIAADVGVGRGRSSVWTCDLTHRYIEINTDYRS